ncbi:complex I NDUFA9 subunit family protein [Aestuariivirga litoralis]|uniref:Complex I NDUFA9 subunit family protein n=1 Tax=Aestuariivirga litoralis TaxID=2650924 RepID=A0A2W2B8L0_9HYPH|nr:complex I NDUFA9 subunit family protein [Aestuariivirga litoralis]PZF76644.1 complex I NDUFA9 subunit family protein [Aestuariivirga litoralis]
MLVQPSDRLITIIGGSGFVGRHIVRALARRGYRIRVACRRPDLAGHLQPLGNTGQIMAVQANVRYPASLEAACEGAYAVINLTGVLHSAGAQSFDAVHVFGAEASAKAARAARARVFIQMSAIGADAVSASAYGRSKAEGEARARANFPGAIVLRPSIVFGPEDGFFNRFAEMARFSPFLPLIGGGETAFQPVFAGDVGEAVARLVDQGEADGKTYELGGPEQFSFRALMQFTLDTIGRKRLLLPLPWGLARLQASILGLLPNPMLTVDQVEMLRHDNVVSEAARREQRTLEGLGVTPQGIEGIVPGYLYRYRKAGQFTAPRGIPE